MFIRILVNSTCISNFTLILNIIYNLLFINFATKTVLFVLYDFVCNCIVQNVFVKKSIMQMQRRFAEKIYPGCRHATYAVHTGYKLTLQVLIGGSWL